MDDSSISNIYGVMRGESFRLSGKIVINQTLGYGEKHKDELPLIGPY